MRLGAVLAAPLVLAASPALAGVFGGFSADGESYLRGKNQICQPIESEEAAPQCRKARADEIARERFRQGTLERGAGARFRARTDGTAIVVYEGKGEPAARFEAGSSVTIEAVYSRARDRLVAVEYSTRFGRRLVEEVVVFDLEDGQGRSVGGGVGAGGTGSVSVKGPAGPGGEETGGAAQPEVDEEARSSALKKGRRLAKRRKWRPAAKAFRELLEAAPGDPEGQFHLAGCLARQGQKGRAIALLAKISRSDHPKAPVWLVEARSHRYFAGLRTDPAWRKAVGLARDPDRERSAYERVVGLGGHWEQAAIPCEQPRVNLRLDRKKRSFSLRIRSKCKGRQDVTRLDGTWEALGTSRLVLTFPNQGADDESLTCKISVCRDSSGEDCVRCRPGPDLEFLLRLVRR